MVIKNSDGYLLKCSNCNRFLKPPKIVVLADNVDSEFVVSYFCDLDCTKEWLREHR